MPPHKWLCIAVGLSLIMIGCKSSKHGSKANALFPKVEVGMSVNDAKAVLDGPGEERVYGDLPVFPKPRDIYAHLPPDTEWRAWSAVGKPTLLLGAARGKIVFKQVLWTEDGERKSDAVTLPEYQ